MNLLCGLGATAFDYKGVSCTELDTRIARLKANMDSNPKRAADAKYKTNYSNFTNEFNSRCGGAISPYSAPLQPGGAYAGLIPGVGTSLLTALNPNLNPAAPVVPVDAYGNPILVEAPFYSSTWFQVALIGGVVAIGLGIFMKKRKKG